jgi:hypothetical protein
VQDCTRVTRAQVCLEDTLLIARDRVDFLEDFRREYITKVVVCFEELRLGMDSPMIDGIEFHCG